jgi:putative ABC transport system permease protein
VRGLSSLAWRSLAARRLRTLLTVLGVALGVGVLFASLATNAGIERSIERTVRDLVGRADLRVEAFHETGLSRRSVEAIRTTPGVDVAVPALERRIYLRRELGLTGPLPPPVTVLGIDPVLDGHVHDLAIVDGSPLLRRDEAGAVISERLARDDDLGLGSELTIDGAGATERFRVVGVVAGDGPLVGAFGRVVILPIDAAARVFGTRGAVDRVDLRVAAPFSVADVEAALVTTLDREPYVLSSPRDLAATLRASTADFQATTALIAAVALFVGAFLIFNTLSMTVAERVREVGLLRAAGATRRQVTGFILAGAAVFGVLGALAGLAVGVALATLTAGYVATLGSVPFDGPELPLSAFLVAAAVGIVVTIAAALEPAWRAGRIPPVEALRLRAEPARGQRARLRWLVAVFAAVAVVGLLTWPRGAGDAGVVRALAVYAVLLVATLASPALLGPLGRIAGAPFARLSKLEERLARGSLVRDRSRTALTVGALTVGLAMIVAVGGVAQNARRSAGAWLASVVPGDFILTSIRPVGLAEPVLGDLESVAGVARVTPVATFDLAFRGVRLDAAAVHGADLLADGHPTVTGGDAAGALAALDAGGAVVLPESQATRLGLGVGDTMAVTGADGGAVDLVVAGIVDHAFPGTTGETVLVGWPDAMDRLGVGGADFFVVRLEPGAPPSVRPALEAAARQVALEPATIDTIQGAIADALARVFGLFDALALVAVLVAALGIVNTLTMNVVERVREIGMLRATGMTRRQVGRMVVVEAGILGLVGAILGGLTGLVAGTVMLVLAGGSLAASFELPWAALALCVVLGVAVSMAAAWYPARLAGRLSIVRAVQFE